MKKILISLAVIAIAAGATLGITGAWWSDQATSVNASFKAGNIDLQFKGIKVNGTGSVEWRNDVGQTWDTTNMSPGGDVLSAALPMKNVGTINSDHMDFAIANTFSEAGMDKFMRITKLTYDGKSLLEGRAGADFSDYQAPTVCDITVDGTDGDPNTPNDIQAGIDAATTGQTVCVTAGTYNGNVKVSEKITLVALNAPNSGSKAIVRGTIDVSTAGVTVKGLRVDGLVVSGQEAAITVAASDVIIDSNVVYDMTGNGSGTIKGIHVYSVSEITDITLTNNWIEKIYDTGKGSVGIMVQGHLNGVTVDHNTIKDVSSDHTGSATWDYALGIEDTPTGGYQGSPLGIVVTDNHIEDIVSVTEPGRGFSVDKASNTNYAYASQVTFTRNDIVNVANDITNKDPRSGRTLNAQNNWFGNNGIHVNVNGINKGEIGSIDTTNYAGGLFVGFINGVDTITNGFADLRDFQEQGIKNVKPGLSNAHERKDLVMDVQLDATTPNQYQGQKVEMTMTVTMQQGPTQ